MVLAKVIIRAVAGTKSIKEEKDKREHVVTMKRESNGDNN